MNRFSILLISMFVSLLCCCNSEEASEYERVNERFTDSLGVDISTQQWWRTTVKLKVDVITDKPVKLWLLSAETGRTYLYDYKEVENSGTVYMTAPQGQGNTVKLTYQYKNRYTTKEITLTGKSEEVITIQTTSSKKSSIAFRAPKASLSGHSIVGGAKYYQFSDTQLEEYFDMMQLSLTNTDAKVLGLNCNYELESNGPFYITWVSGYERAQDSHILGYYFHPSNTWDGIEYQDLSETHKWDYIDNLAKVQYQIPFDDNEMNIRANTWYDANFDLTDKYNPTEWVNIDRVGDDAYNSQEVFNRYGRSISALRGISFLIDVPEGMRIGFFLRSDEDPRPDQWTLLKNNGISPYIENRNDFKGTCFCGEFMNVVGNGRGFHRSFIKGKSEDDEVYWMGMEDLVDGGDHDCNDVIFGVVAADVSVKLPTIVSPELTEEDNTYLDDSDPFPWTLAFEDVNRDADFDFNDAVIKLEPDYVNEQCCVTVMAAGSNARMYLHFDGPNGDENLGEIHDLLGSKSQTFINTDGAVANSPFVQVDCVPWPKEYTMANDAKRFYIEIQRGTCDDCTDVITLADEPGKMPEALLVSGVWHWPMEGYHINSVYNEFGKWAHDITRTRFWDWYSKHEEYNYVGF